MDNQIQGGIIDGSVFAPPHFECASFEEALLAVTHATLLNALLLNVREAN